MYVSFKGHLRGFLYKLKKKIWKQKNFLVDNGLMKAQNSSLNITGDSLFKLRIIWLHCDLLTESNTDI